MTAKKTAPKALLYTERGKKWLAQFDASDQEIARKIVSSLTLISHSEFERVIQSALESLAATHENPIAFYAVREVEHCASYFEQYTNPTTGQIDALVPGSDHGSEARVAAVIRNYCKTDPDRFLNHPSLKEMRIKQCRTVVLVDDFIGSGERTKQFAEALWIDPTFVSWLSLKYLKVVVVAYSGTDRGTKVVKKHKANPEVIIERSCPAFKEMPWGRRLRESVLDVCKRYGLRTSMGYWWEGYGQEMAALVFEHGCPDNSPAILWAPNEDNKPWQPLFPNRVILAGEKSVFPPEIVRGDPLVTLLDVGQKNLALSGQLSRRGELGTTILLILALIAKGQRRQNALCFATGLNGKACVEITDRCIKWGFLTPSRRLTVRGHAELKAAKELGDVYAGVLEKGDEYYFPKELRRATGG